MGLLRCASPKPSLRYGFDAPRFTRLALRAPSASLALSGLAEPALFVGPSSQAFPKSQKNRPQGPVLFVMAERVGFEPTIELPLCRISSAVLSTTQPPLRYQKRFSCPEAETRGRKRACTYSAPQRSASPFIIFMAFLFAPQVRAWIFYRERRPKCGDVMAKSASVSFRCQVSLKRRKMSTFLTKSVFGCFAKGLPDAMKAGTLCVVANNGCAFDGQERART